MSPYLVLLPILEFFSCLISHATLCSSFNITKFLANLLTKPIFFIRIFISIPIVFCNLVSMKCIIIIILSCLTSSDSSKPIQKKIFVNHEGISTPITT